MTRHDDDIPRDAFDALDLRNPPDGKGPLAKTVKSPKTSTVVARNTRPGGEVLADHVPEGRVGGRADPKLIKQLQMFLVTLGFDLGKTGPTKDGVDGVFGDATEKAVKAFQSQHGDFRGNALKVDGIVGPKTADALNRAMVGVPNDDGIDLDVAKTAKALTKPDNFLLITCTRAGLRKGHENAVIDFTKIRGDDPLKLRLHVVD